MDIRMETNRSPSKYFPLDSTNHGQSMNVIVVSWKLRQATPQSKVILVSDIPFIIYCIFTSIDPLCARCSLGSCPLTKLKYFSFDHSILFDSLHTLYLGVFKRLCLLLFSKARNDRRQRWSLYNKINSIDEGLANVKIPTTTSRRFRTIREITRFKANEFRSLMHHGSTVLLQAMLPKYRRHFALLLAAVNTASKDIIRTSDIAVIEATSKRFVEQWQEIFGLRYMSSNIHSLLHLHESVAFMGPLYMYSTFNFEGESLT